MKRHPLLFLTFLLLVIYNFIFIFLPPYLKDELFYYLALPHYWRLTNTFGPVYWFTPSHFPPFLMWLYYLVSPEHYIIAHLIGFLGLCLLISFLYFYSRTFHVKHFPDNFFISAILLLLIPVVIQIGASAYAGIWSAAFIGFYFYFLLLYKKKRRFLFLIISAFFLSLSVGTKYTGLTMGVILGLLSTLLLDNKKQAILYLTITPLVVAIINSPWMIMNYNDTGNPIYPILGKFFTLKHVQHFNPQPIKFSIHITPLMERALIYKENIFQIITAPIRIFFYGKDGVPALFDGALAGYLLIFPLFIWKKSRELRVTIIASLVYLIILFLSFPLRARYLLPIVPFMVIASTEGFFSIANTKKYLAYFLLMFTLAFPVYYLYSHTIKTEIFPFITGRISKDAWQERHVPYFSAYKEINNLRCNGVFLYFMGRRGYYINKPFAFEPSYNVEGAWFYYSFLKNSPEIFLSLHTDCIAVNKFLFNRFIKINFKPEEIQVLPRFFEKYFKLIYNDNIIEVWKIRLERF